MTNETRTCGHNSLIYELGLIVWWAGLLEEWIYQMAESLGEERIRASSAKIALGRVRTLASSLPFNSEEAARFSEWCQRANTAVEKRHEAIHATSILIKEEEGLVPVEARTRKGMLGKRTRLTLKRRMQTRMFIESAANEAIAILRLVEASRRRAPRA